MIATFVIGQLIYCCLQPISSHAVSVNARLGLLHCENTSVDFKTINLLVKCLCFTYMIFCRSPELPAQGASNVLKAVFTHCFLHDKKQNF